MENLKKDLADFTQYDFEVLFFETPLLHYIGWDAFFKYRLVCKKWNRLLNTEYWWKQACKVFAETKGLALSSPSDFNSTPSWRIVFTTDLWPSRNKFRDTHLLRDTEQTGFNILVTARFRPGDESTRRNDFVLPLHQRLRIRKKGEMLSFEAAERGLGENVIQDLVGSSSLSPEIVRALVEASKLGHMAHRARVDANHFANQDMEFDDNDGGVGNGLMLEEDTNANANANAHNANGLQFDDDTSNRDEVQEEESNRRRTHGHAPRHGGQARVLALQESQAIMYIPGHGIRQFFFEHVINPQSTQHEVYAKAAKPMVYGFLNGLNSCLFTYGQTGSGKTYTVFGPPDVLSKSFSSKLPNSAGVVPRACQDVFQEADKLISYGVKIRIQAQYVQIYDEKITDLVSGNDVTLLARVDSLECVLKDALVTDVATLNDVILLLQQGQERKKVAATACNDHSSRAHTVFILRASQIHHGILVKSHMHFVDLAGCEQLKFSQATGIRRAEAIQINSSLMVLTKCIRALVEAKSHVPFRESVLTRLLRSSLGGSCRTSTIITGAMDDARAQQTLQALRFGETIAQITNTIGGATGMNADVAFATLRANLGKVHHTLRSLEARGKSHLETYQKASRMAQALDRQCNELQAMAQP